MNPEASRLRIHLPRWSAVLCAAIAALVSPRASAEGNLARPNLHAPVRQEQVASPEPTMQAVTDPASGQIDVLEAGKRVLRYNYRTVHPGEGVRDKVAEVSRIYAQPRSNYIHPLHSLDGEVLTEDWPVDHPHHRGIYWAWPEVRYGAELGDPHALQRIFSRPTSDVKLTNGPDFAEVVAENDWVWDGADRIVHERATIRVHRATPEGRSIDLICRFTALRDGVSLARRDTKHYGGLNVRLAPPKQQEISHTVGHAEDAPRRAWSDLSGRFGASEAVSGLSIFQHAENPDYPGDWVLYPELGWCQPTFPASGTRHVLVPGKPLELRWRLWVHRGGKPETQRMAELWDAFHASVPVRPECPPRETPQSR